MAEKANGTTRFPFSGDARCMVAVQLNLVLVTESRFTQNISKEISDSSVKGISTIIVCLLHFKVCLHIVLGLSKYSGYQLTTHSDKVTCLSFSPKQTQSR